MKKFILLVLGVIVIGVIGAVIYISSIDWNEHKDKLASEFYEMTGKRISFDGPLSLELMPYPSLNAKDVKIYNPRDIKARPLVEVKELVAELSSRPLLSGVFEVKRMILEQPQINVELLDDGRLNWQSDENAETPKTEISLNSVSLNDAKVLYEDLGRNINFTIENMSGEIVAQSLLGPYRIEGNYIKSGVPQGFAVSVGKLSDSMATSLNLVFTHPVSKSYLRFDGSFMFKNKVLNGNTIFESEGLKEFWEANWPKKKFDDKYNYPLALTFDIAINERQANLSNVVVKYGESQGAGNMKIPLDEDGVDDESRPRIDLAFNFTDLNLDPVAYTLQNMINSYKKDGVYEPDFSYDVLADIKSVRTQYNGQAIKNFETSFDVIDNIITVNNVSAVLPGNTDVKFKGEISSFEDKPFYNTDISFKSSDFLKTLNWLGISPVTSVASTYKKTEGAAKLVGTLERIQISPFNVKMDKSSFSGEAGIKLGERPDMLVTLNADMINFDNYVVAIPEEEKAKGWIERMQYRFSRLGILNNFEAQIIAKIDLGIYENIPFEKIDFDAVLLNGNLDIKKLHIASVVNAEIGLSGQLSGFGKSISFQDLNYQIKTSNTAAFIEKLGLSAPDIDFKKYNDLYSEGVITGDVRHFAFNLHSKLNDLAWDFQGQAILNDKIYSYDGKLDVRHPEFVNMLEYFDSSYIPQGQVMGLFYVQTEVKGTPQLFKVKINNGNIGYNEFSGEIDYEDINSRPQYIVDLKFNKFEVERFLNKYQSDGTKAIINPDDSEIVEFLARPHWSDETIDYDFYKTFDLNGNISVQDLSYYGAKVKDSSFGVALQKGVLEIQNMRGIIGNGSAIAEGFLNMNNEPKLNVNAELENVNVSIFKLVGKTYGFNKGILKGKLTLSGNAVSQTEFFKTLDGRGNFSLSDVIIKGWDLAANGADIKKRENSEGMAELIKANLMKGVTGFNTFNGNFNIENGAYSFSNSVMRGNGAEVKVFGGGSFVPWDVGLNFEVKYDETKYMPGYAFSLKGPTNAPNLDVDTSALFNLYKSRQDKIDNDVRILHQAEENRIKSLVEEQKNIASNIVTEIRRDIDDEILKKMQKIYDNNTVQKYNILRQEAGKVAASLVDKTNLDNPGYLSEETVDELKLINQQGMVDLEKMKKELNQIYLDDVKNNVGKVYEQIVSNLNQFKQIAFQYNTTREAFDKRLADIITKYRLNNDVNIQSWDTFVEDKTSAFEAESVKILDEKQEILASNDTEKVVFYNRNLEQLLVSLDTDISVVENTLSEMKQYAEQKVLKEEELYSNKLREQEVQRKVQENKGSISIKKSGRTVEVVRNIEDIEKAEELVEDKEIRVLDFSKPKKQNVTQEKKSQQNVVKKGRVNVN